MRDGCFQLFVQILCAADKTHRRHTVAACVERMFGSVYQCLMVGQAQVVVGAKVEYGFSVDGDFGALGRADESLVFVQTGLFDCGQFG